MTNNFSYPTSINAKRFGFYETGCYTVELIDHLGWDTPKALKGFLNKEDAIRYADSLQMSYSNLYQKYFDINANHKPLK